MNKQKALRPVNLALAFVLVCLVTSALLDDVIPRDIYSKVHPILGYTFVLCLAAHVFLNWPWIKANYLSKKGAK